ncbi:hypothetical protein Pla22_01280 [Rubripirellula amarantea]|uniref:Uncharacterized protein n=1 Tax=Rubripirellula amarantea TaxID=2527999 RepID=A0A5C5WNV2_9BACT|nr:hypothetical protein Pla22_01280 [Rubripirellula amarantea]
MRIPDTLITLEALHSNRATKRFLHSLGGLGRAPVAEHFIQNELSHGSQRPI